MATEPESNIPRRPQTKTHLLVGESSQTFFLSFGVREKKKGCILCYRSNINSYRTHSHTTKKKAIEEQRRHQRVCCCCGLPEG